MPTELSCNLEQQKKLLAREVIARMYVVTQCYAVMLYTNARGNCVPVHVCVAMIHEPGASMKDAQLSMCVCVYDVRSGAHAVDIDSCSCCVCV